MTVIDKSELDALNKRMEDLKQEMKIAGGDYFKMATLAVFEEYPELESFAWTQYTPYFMDGDVCEFGVNPDYIDAVINGTEVEVSKCYGEWNALEKRYDPKPEEEYTTAEKLGDVLPGLVSSVNEDVMKDLFGDHAKVTVNREGIIVEEYEHD